MLTVIFRCELSVKMPTLFKIAPLVHAGGYLHIVWHIGFVGLLLVCLLDVCVGVDVSPHLTYNPITWSPGLSGVESVAQESISLTTGTNQKDQRQAQAQLTTNEPSLPGSKRLIAETKT